MRDEPDPRVALVERFFQGTGSSYDFMVNASTFGIDRLWKRRIVSLLPTDSRRVADLACGTGILTLAIARHLPRCHVVGVELRDEYLSIARAKLGRSGLRNVELVLSRAEDYLGTEPFDCIASSYLAKYADLPRLVDKAWQMLTPGGLLLMHDFTYPPKPHLVRTWRVYFYLLQRMGRVFPAWREIYHGLPELIEHTRWLEELPAALQAHGFTDIHREDLTLYGSAIVTARRPA
ncbi:class I SAM-dependent methyltransferase [Ramlibacter rhizophilus]|uniref:Methyltransferase domain-containing protein n=1 Tax=Ramlibacter rhizophilus TaxID=1781167 RepID=A0A4Z0BFR0_9BURK|nr:class I SAM-dependent methyltransferase [Ramlibacter rhizophilus]TFY97521.1 methyltransferase domain-containing protein [Ramlibacter rhizophilus]